jgi:hypothetical protein
VLLAQQVQEGIQRNGRRKSLILDRVTPAQRTSLRRSLRGAA